MHNIYLDHAATTPLSNSMKQYITQLLDIYANPSSTYESGQKTRKMIEDSRLAVSHFIGADPNESNILFTPSGSASNTLAIAGYYRKHNCTIYYSPTSHKSILKCVDNYRYSYSLKVDGNGFIDLKNLRNWLDGNHSKPFVVIDYASSEIGTIQPVQQIIDLVHFYNGIIYVDCTGSISTVPINVKELDVDMIGFSGHKLGALKGVGILYKKKEIELEPLIYGEQEQHLCAGTENILGIASLGKAIESKNYNSVSEENAQMVWEYIYAHFSSAYLVGAPINSRKRLPHNLYICFPGITGESLLILLDMHGIQIATGSACSSASLEPSPTLTAIGMNKEDINSCIRLSFSGYESEDELIYICSTINKCVHQLQNSQ